MAMRTSVLTPDNDLLRQLPGAVTEAVKKEVPHPTLVEVERSLTRLLAASLTLMARSSFFVEETLPTLTFTQLAEATAELESRNIALFMDSTLTENMHQTVRQNMARISHVSVVGRVGLHMQRLEALVHNHTEQRWIVSCFGPSADALFLMGTRILNALTSPELETPEFAQEALHWESIMLEGTLQSAQAEIHQTGVLSRPGRRYAKATLWAFQVARDALIAVRNN